MVKCKDCGYLAAKNKLREHIETDENIRETARFLVSIGNVDTPYLYCVAQCEQFRNELVVKRETSDFIGPARREDILKELEREHDCKRFRKYYCGKTAKEHFEMDLIEREEERHREQVESDRRWRVAQAERTQERHDESMEQSRKQHSKDLFTFGWIMGLVQLLAAGVAAYATYWAGRIPLQ